MLLEVSGAVVWRLVELEAAALLLAVSGAVVWLLVE